MTQALPAPEDMDLDSPPDLPEFVPTYARPLPGMQCTGIVKNGDNAGERCRRRAVYGHWVCFYHGGKLKSVQRKAAENVVTARMALLGDAPTAVEVLTELMLASASDAVRLKAATEVLDRAGIRGGTEIDVNVSQADPGDELRQRLDQLRERAHPALEAIAGEDTDDGVQDAEIVVESDDATSAGEGPEDLGRGGDPSPLGQPTQSLDPSGG